LRARPAGGRAYRHHQIRAFLLERGIAVRQGLRFLRTELPRILASRTDTLSPRMLGGIEDLAGDWHRLEERVETGRTYGRRQIIEAGTPGEKSCRVIFDKLQGGPIHCIAESHCVVRSWKNFSLKRRAGRS
jgi:transposase